VKSAAKKTPANSAKSDGHGENACGGGVGGEGDGGLGKAPASAKGKGKKRARAGGKVQKEREDLRDDVPHLVKDEVYVCVCVYR
jgi:hypothetical protein